MKIHVLVENTANRPELVAEHGLSLLIEACGKRILFDTGATGAFADNAERMGINLSEVDVAVLSHGHYDHGGGIARFLALNSHATVWVSPHAFAPHFNASGKDICLAPELQLHTQLCSTSAPVLSLAPGITLHQANDMPMAYPCAGDGMETIDNGIRTADTFRHEQYLLLEENNRRVLISGCSHRGILNISAYFQPDILIGGFHYMRAGEETLRHAAEQLLKQPTIYYTGHCTGDTAFLYLKQHLGNRLHAFRTGDTIELSTPLCTHVTL